MCQIVKSSIIAGTLLANLAQADFLREPLRDPGLECASYDSEGWLTIYDGSAAVAEKYWWISNSSHGNGGNWWVAEDPELVKAGKLQAGQKILWSNQNPGGNGGLLYTMRKYRDIEVRVSVFPGWKNDGGLFLRSNGKGAAWQIMFDYRPGGTVGGIWPEGLNAPSQDYYNFATEIKVDTKLAKWPAADWPKIWDADGFNMVHAKVTGEPPVIRAYMKESTYVITDYNATKQSALTETGHVGLQIHAGEGSWQGGPNKYQFMKVKELDPVTGKPLCAPVPGNKPYNPSPTVGVRPGLRAEGLQLAWSNDGAGLRVSGPVAGAWRLTLTDVFGRVLSKAGGEAGFADLEFPGLTKGVYFVNLASGTDFRTYKAVRL